MKQKIKIYDYDFEIERTSEKDKEIVDLIIKWIEKNDIFDGESLMDNDEAIIDAPQLIAEIMDDYLAMKKIEK